ncbi:hypothetical protein POTOM_055179 [Populus tomentosa]|uniref:Uncharacterized protein n=1 Tax=Populus tomentosa TaxID=118781 RepID=A0A8X7Y0N9_POPTO|nr:hypothetical protein POTOM_055179 [Populus tomentosa]
MVGSLPPCEFLWRRSASDITVEAGRNIGLSLVVFVYAMLIMGRKCREMSGWDSLMDSGVKNFHYWTENHFYEFAFGVQAMVAPLSKRERGACRVVVGAVGMGGGYCGGLIWLFGLV